MRSFDKNKTWFKVIPSIIVVLSSPSLYANCEEINLKTPGFSMENVTQRNQGWLDNCYAHAATKAFEAKLKLTKAVPASFNASVIATTIGYKKEDKNPVTFSGPAGRHYVDYVIGHLKGGLTCPAINFLKTYGVCDEDTLEGKLHKKMEKDKFGQGANFISDIMQLHSAHNETVRTAFDHYGKEFNENEIEISRISVRINAINNQVSDDENFDGGSAAMKKFLESPLGKEREKLEERKETLLERQLEIVRNLRSPIYHQLLKEMRDPAVEWIPFRSVAECNILRPEFGSIEQAETFIREIQNDLAELDPILFLEALVNSQCKNRVKLPAEFLETQCRQLLVKDPKKASAFIENEFSRGEDAGPLPLNINGQLLKEKPGFRGNRGENGHAVLLIGRKKVGKGCQYLIRNSWDQDCSSTPGWSCEQGDVWIPEEDLFANTSLITNPFSSK